MAFPYSWCSQSLLYEMGAELMFPLPESFVAGYMTLLNNLFVDFVYLLLYVYPHFGNYILYTRTQNINVSLDIPSKYREQYVLKMFQIQKERSSFFSKCLSCKILLSFFRSPFRDFIINNMIIQKIKYIIKYI